MIMCVQLDCKISMVYEYRHAVLSLEIKIFQLVLRDHSCSETPSICTHLQLILLQCYQPAFGENSSANMTNHPVLHLWPNLSWLHNMVISIIQCLNEWLSHHCCLLQSAW